MIEVRPFSSLGGGNHGWLDAKHHFSFADYRDPKRVNWGALRVWNDDVIAPHTGFAPHPHNDMEIITYVRSGAITHRDSLAKRIIHRARIVATLFDVGRVGRLAQYRPHLFRDRNQQMPE